MPSKNTIKQYVEGGYYHIYNRGVEKRIIFLDKQDHVVFLRFLKEYLLPPDHQQIKKLQRINPRRHAVNCHNDIDLLAYCLMPNHFHLFIKQKTQEGLKTFMKALSTNYVMYFNHKYERVGPLFQGIYKAALIRKERHLLHITRYIHLNPEEILTNNQLLQNYPYSSYKYYLRVNKPDWLKPNEILALFRSSKSLFPEDILSYEAFVELYKDNNKRNLKGLTLE